MKKVHNIGLFTLEEILEIRPQEMVVILHFHYVCLVPHRNVIMMESFYIDAAVGITIKPFPVA